MPDQEVFAQAVARQLNQPENPDVLARSYRASPALVRQHHFALVSKEHFPIVVRSEELDLHGLDLMLVESGQAFSIALSVPTVRARSWQRVKRVRHPDSPEHLPVLCLYAEPDEYAIGQVWLHHLEQWKQIQRWIDDITRTRSIREII